MRVRVGNSGDSRMSAGDTPDPIRTLIEVHERERTWVARELHDDICQRVIGLTLQLQALNQTSLGNDDVRRVLAEVCEQLGRLGADIQGISHRLHSAKIELLGLAVAAEGLCREFSTQHGVTIVFKDRGVPANLPKAVAIGLYRVLQEALSNGIKHSGVREFAVALNRDRDQIQLDVRDGGAGFEPEIAIRSHGLGLISMRERLALVHGELSIESRPGAGTTIRARVPLHHGSGQRFSRAH